MLRTVLAFLVVLLGLVSIAHADAPHTTPHTTPPPPPSWHGLYQQGTTAYQAGRFDEALQDFQQARAQGGPEELIYNIALTLDRLGRTQEAIAAYQQYLDAAPDADNRDVVEARLAQLSPLSGTIATHVAPPPGPILSLVDAGVPASTTTTTTTTTTDATDAYTATQPIATGDHWEQQGPEWIASWVFLALTAATSVATVIVWQDGLSHFQQLQDLCAMGCTQMDIDASSAHTSQDATNALLGVSIGLGAVTILTFVLEGVVSGNRRRFVRGDVAHASGPQLSIGLTGLSISGTF